MSVRFIPSPIGKLRLTAHGGRLAGVDLACASEVDNRVPDEDISEVDSRVLDEATRQLGEYFCGSRKTFDLPIAMNGSEFCTSVWTAARDIPYGSTVTYGELARTIGRPKAARAVGSCLHRNELLIVVPCHRVVSASGLGGFALGLEIKRLLIGLERGKWDKREFFRA